MPSKNKRTIANKKWQDKNKQHAKYLSDRSRAKSFLMKQATQDDLSRFSEIIKKRFEENNKKDVTN
ncbi:hypothetical protein [Fructilactobacillus fructivorans]|uniref:hypothetical protein n=1 Tax=Fructilactobacillus fructivorans TaxID=1614 RepID=UPI0002196F9E|nr:hypothetical protein [Fructilactobacillus fructivorans]KRK58516.1 hypothetical protein FC73_GL000071 [Fructilactobacillus fructivorans]KRN13361.1 hypothetical protein IV37_GL000077 [Fructilactobacillus fructivorans]KRN40070.1 hypothetical protein IV51_GL000251 [Fructilactobacillus fructivorans]KRN42497.1 hypothetical protein IV48_GL000145 [Fructilactobacillus fructivorans]